jgi:acetyl esterase/lipase
MNKRAGRPSAFSSLLHREHGVSRSLRLILLACLVAVGGIGIVQRVGAVTADDYCNQYTNSSQRNACRDGLRSGTDCADYAITFDEATANICRKAKQAKQNGEVTDSPTFNANDVCKKYTGDLLTACNGGKSYKECNIQVAEVDVALYNACATGAGLDTISIPDSATDPQGGANDADVYKNVILDACSPYQNNTAAALWCLYGGLGPDGAEGKPKTILNCLTKPELQGSSTNKTACITGVTAGRTYLSEARKNSSEQRNPLEILDQLDQVNSLTKYIDVLHELGPDADVDTTEEPDNNYGSYVNGAGKQQELKVYPGGPPNAPVILIMNGGGWHVNDGNSDKITAGLNGGEDPRTRGYKVIELTYRLGSSGIYYMFEDVMRGIRHVINNAGMYGIDPARVAIWGDSAGGSLSMRAAASGKSGAKAAVGWSAPTNAYTAMFRSFESFAISIDHSTCIPTDLAGFANFTDLLSGGSGNIAEYGQGLSSNDFSSLGIDLGTQSLDPSSINPISLLTEVFTAGQYALQTGQNLESISSQLESGGIQGLSGGVLNLSSKKFIECIDNLSAASPALFASPESSPSYLAGFETDPLIPPDNAYDMRDKLRSLGIRSETLIIPGNSEGGSGFGNHLDYDPRFVCPTLNFLDSIMQPERGQTNCSSGLTDFGGSGSPPEVAQFAEFLDSVGGGLSGGGGGIGGLINISGGIGGLSGLGGNITGNLSGVGIFGGSN